nr:RecA [Vibrio cholerae]
MLLVRRPKRLAWWILPVCDAIGLAVFVGIGVEKALIYQDSALIAIIMGVITGCGGGIIRDVLAREIPMVLRSEVYATAVLWWHFNYALAMGYSSSRGTALLGGFFHALNSSRSDPVAPFSANLCPDQITGSAPNAPCEVPLSQKSPSYLKLSSLCELNARPRLRFHITSTHLFPFVINTCYSKALKPYWCSAKEKTMSRTGSQLYISQSAVSKRIANLEKKLSKKLIVPAGRHIKLTADAEQIIASIGPTFNELHGLIFEQQTLEDNTLLGMDCSETLVAGYLGTCRHASLALARRWGNIARSQARSHWVITTNHRNASIRTLRVITTNHTPRIVENVQSGKATLGFCAGYLPANPFTVLAKRRCTHCQVSLSPMI